MTYKSFIRAAQIVFLVVIPKKMVYAGTQNAFIYDGKEFLSTDHCEIVSKTAIPFYIVQQDLYGANSNILKGTLVTLGKNAAPSAIEKPFTILKNPKSSGITGTHHISLEYVDIATNWTLQVHQTKNTPFDLTGLSLKLKTTNDKISYQRCCTGNKCADLPIFSVLDGTQTVGQIAFSPSAKDFITSYSVSRTGATPQQNTPLKTANSPVPIDPTQNTEITALAAADVPPVSTPQQKVICTTSSPLRIYNDSLKTVIYKAPRYLPVKVFQSWSGGPAQQKVNGYDVVKVQLTTGAGKEINGWAADAFIKPAQECKGMPLMYGGKDGEEVIPGSTVVVDAPANCCRFPTLKPPSANYDASSGNRYFGARRRNGQRAHAAADLLRPTGEKVLAIDGGKVLRKYHFYAGTYAIEVKHDMGYVARYGEVAKQNVASSGPGERVIKGQHIGNIGSLRMLHFELYSDKASGPLTQSHVGKYWRRSDLLDPTPLLNKWQDMTF